MIYKLNVTFFGYFELTLEDIINANPEIEVKSPQKVNNKTAFIVHGHDNELKTELQLLLNRAGVNSIVLHEQADKGRTIIDKLIGETETAGYAIALLTPDDLTKDGNNRARQNVILEIGFFLGKLGKERIRMVVKGDVEIPSDLHGILYEKHDPNGAWKIKLLKELQAVGIYVDLQAAINQF
jgi:predicted nucleotide-binding protein